MAPMHITADRVFDATGGPTLLRPVLRLDGDRIETISAGPIPVGCVDFPGCTILPGLIDTHVHLVFSAAETNAAIIEQVGRETEDELFARALANARAALRAGITTARDCGGK